MKALTLLLALCLFTACDSHTQKADPLEYEPGTPIPLPEEQVTSPKLWIFTAPWCEPCHQLHNDFIPRVKEIEGAIVEAIVETGNSQSQPPTEASCAQYKEKLQAPYAFLPDPWRGTLYKKFIGPSVTIPAAIVFDEEGNVLQKFKPGTFNASTLINYLKKLMESRG